MQNSLPSGVGDGYPDNCVYIATVCSARPRAGVSLLDQLGCATIMIRWCTTSAMASRPGERYLRASMTVVSPSASRTAFVNAMFRIVPMLTLVIPRVTA